MSQEQRIDELVKLLNQASAAYYSGREELMTNYEWDALFDEPQVLEAQTNYRHPDSPTQRTSDCDEAGTTDSHEYPALYQIGRA